jgi:hypothetical protein
MAMLPIHISGQRFALLASGDRVIAATEVGRT